MVCTALPDKETRTSDLNDIRVMIDDSIPGIDSRGVSRRALLDGARWYCSESYCWRYNRQNITVPAGDTEITINPSTISEVVKILRVYEVLSDGSEVELPKFGDPVYDESAYRSGVSWTELSPWTIGFDKPLEEETSFRLTVALQPINDLDQLGSFPADVYSVNWRGIKLAAMSLLYDQQDRDWFDPGLGASSRNQMLAMAKEHKTRYLNDLGASRQKDMNDLPRSVLYWR